MSLSSSYDLKMEVVSTSEIMTSPTKPYGVIIEKIRTRRIVATVRTSNLISKPAVQKFFKYL
jgi:hypothetical protein